MLHTLAYQGQFAKNWQYEDRAIEKANYTPSKCENPIFIKIFTCSFDWISMTKLIQMQYLSHNLGLKVK